MLAYLLPRINLIHVFLKAFWVYFQNIMGFSQGCISGQIFTAYAYAYAYTLTAYAYAYTAYAYTYYTYTAYGYRLRH